MLPVFLVLRNLRIFLTLEDTRTFLYNGDLQLFPGVDQPPHLEVPYPLTNGGQQLRHASGHCPVHQASVTCICFT